MTNKEILLTIESHLTSDSRKNFEYLANLFCQYHSGAIPSKDRAPFFIKLDIVKQILSNCYDEIFDADFYLGEGSDISSNQLELSKFALALFLLEELIRQKKVEDAYKLCCDLENECIKIEEHYNTNNLKSIPITFRYYLSEMDSVLCDHYYPADNLMAFIYNIVELLVIKTILVYLLRGFDEAYYIYQKNMEYNPVSTYTAFEMFKIALSNYRLMTGVNILNRIQPYIYFNKDPHQYIGCIKAYYRIAGENDIVLALNSFRSYKDFIKQLDPNIKHRIEGNFKLDLNPEIVSIVLPKYANAVFQRDENKTQYFSNCLSQLVTQEELNTLLKKYMEENNISLNANL